MNNHSNNPRRYAVIGLLAVAAVIVLIYLFEPGRLRAVIAHLANKESHPGTLLLLFFFLPVAGFPISIFLLLIGAKFETGSALLVLFAGMAFHQILTYCAGTTLLRPLLEKRLAKRNVHLPRFPKKGFVWPCIAFMALPGLSYALKNYILSLSGVPFRYFFPISWLTQGIRGIPMVMAGDAAGNRQLALIPILLAFLSAGYAVRLFIKRRKSTRPQWPR